MLPSVNKTGLDPLCIIISKAILFGLLKFIHEQSKMAPDTFALWAETII